VLIDPGFFDWITVKYHIVQSGRRRYPPLTLLIIKHPIALSLALPLEKITTLQPHTHYHLNQNLLFNINLMARAAGIWPILLKETLKMPGTLPGLPLPKKQWPLGRGETVDIRKAVEFLLHPLETFAKQFAYPGSSNPLVVSFLERLQRHLPSTSRLVFPNRWGDRETFKAARLEGEPALETGPAPAPGKPLPPAIFHYSERTFTRFYPSEKIPAAPAQTRESLKERTAVPGSIAVFKPSGGVAKSLTKFQALTRFQAKSQEFPGFLYFREAGTLAPVVREAREGREFIAMGPGRKPGSPAAPYPASQKSAPALNYTDPLQNALEGIKQTVAGVEKKVKEEITAIRKSYPEVSAAAVQQQAVPPGITADIDRLTDRVYRVLERKIKTEKERRGW